MLLQLQCNFLPQPTGFSADPQTCQGGCCHRAFAHATASAGNTDIHMAPSFTFFRPLLEECDLLIQALLDSRISCCNLLHQALSILLPCCRTCCCLTPYLYVFVCLFAPPPQPWSSRRAAVFGFGSLLYAKCLELPLDPIKCSTDTS